MLEHRVEAGVRCMSVLHYLRRAFPTVPAFAFREALKKRDVRVNGTRCLAEALVSAGDTVRVYLDAKYESASLRVLYVDEKLLVVEKPQGLPVDADMVGVGADTLLARAREKYPDARLCHRLDTGTGGVILLSRNEAMHEALLEAFRQETLTKTYAMAVFGKPEPSQGSLRGYIVKDARCALARVSEDFVPGARSAWTEYRVLCTGEKNGYLVSMAEAMLHTGRTHQIRAHMAHAGWPLVGDDKYGSREANAKLHARMPSLWCRRIILNGEMLPEKYRGLTMESRPGFPLWKEFTK